MDAYLSLVSSLGATSPPSRDTFTNLVVLSPSTHHALQADLAKKEREGSWSVAALGRVLTRSAGPPPSSSSAGPPSSSSSASLDSHLAQRLAVALRALLEYVRDCPPLSDLVRTDDKSRAAWEARCPLSAYTTAHARWSIVFARLSSLFVGPNSPLWVAGAFRYASSAFLTLSIRIDTLRNQANKFPTLTDCTAKLAGPVRAAGTDRSAAQGQHTKRGAVLWLGNDCLRGYFKLNNLKLCETVLKSIQEAFTQNRDFDPSDTTGEAPYPMSERVRYRYYLGRVRLSQGRIRQGYTHLQWALDHTHAAAGGPQMRRILLHLLPCALALGHRPAPPLADLVRSRFPDVAALYVPLFEAYARPDFARFEEVIRQRDRKEALRRLGVYLMLREKCPAGMWRGIVKRCLLLSLPSNPTNPHAPPTLSLTQLSKAVYFSHSLRGGGGGAPSADMTDVDRDFDLVDLECILASLVDQGYIKGYTFHSKKMVVFQKGESRGFPPVSAVY